MQMFVEAEERSAERNRLFEEKVRSQELKEQREYEDKIRKEEDIRRKEEREFQMQMAKMQSTMFQGLGELMQKSMPNVNTMPAHHMQYDQNYPSRGEYNTMPVHPMRNDSSFEPEMDTFTDALRGAMDGQHYTNL